MSTAQEPILKIAPNVKLGKCVTLYGFVNLYGCEIGDSTRIGAFVEIQKGVKIGANCKILVTLSSAKESQSRTTFLLDME